MRAVALTTSATIGASDLSIGAAASGTSRERCEPARTLQQMEREYVERVMRESGWNKRQACRILGVSRPRLDRLLERHGIVVTERRAP